MCVCVCARLHDYVWECVNLWRREYMYMYMCVSVFAFFVWESMYVCKTLCLSICVCDWEYLCMRVSLLMLCLCAWMGMWKCIHLYVYASLREKDNMCICNWALCVRLHKRVRVCIFIYACMCVRVIECVHKCVWQSEYIQSVYILSVFSMRTHACVGVYFACVCN